ncbi:MAG: hypothetical protein ACK5KL_19245 [Dysgonomonas sp.]
MKKVLKFILILLLVLVVFLAIFAIIIKIKNESFIGSTDKNFVAYLENNKAIFNHKTLTDGDRQSIFNDNVYDNNIILLGETHGYADVQTIDKALILHFNKIKGTRYYIAEMDSLVAGSLNTFLSGNEKDLSLLQDVVKRVKKRIPQQGGKELFQKWSDIYDYNKSLPDSAKIIVIGVDKNLGDTTKISRDSAMIVNFTNSVKELKLENESFYGLLGMFHTLQEGINKNNARSFAARLKSRGFDIKSIACLNIESEVYFPKMEEFPSPEDEKLTLLNMDGPLVLVHGINDLKEASERNTITLFNLEKDGSPYRNSTRLMQIKTNFLNQDMSPYDETLSATDFMQYIIFLRGAKPITPLE